jgi:hypothetical protein
MYNIEDNNTEKYDIFNDNYEKDNLSGGGIFGLINFTKLFFIMLVLCTLAYFSLQIQKNKFDKKYTVALLVIFVFALIGGIFHRFLRGPGPYGIFYILKFFFLFGPIFTIFVLLILLGQDKF